MSLANIYCFERNKWPKQPCKRFRSQNFRKTEYLANRKLPGRKFYKTYFSALTKTFYWKIHYINCMDFIEMILSVNRYHPNAYTQNRSLLTATRHLCPCCIHWYNFTPIIPSVFFFRWSIICPVVLCCLNIQCLFAKTPGVNLNANVYTRTR